MWHRRLYIAGILCGFLSAGTWAHGEPAPAPGFWTTTGLLASNAWESTLRALQGDRREDGFSRLWDSLLPRLDQAVTLTDRQESLPESTWFGEDQSSNEQAVNKLLDEAATILSTSPGQNYRQRIRELEQAVHEAREEIAKYRTQRVSAPQSSLWRTTSEGYDTRIQKRQADIARYEKELEQLRGAFAADLRSLGLDLSEQELEFLLSTVVGDDLIRMTLAFDNVKAVTSQLEKLVEESGEDLEHARRYYGMYSVLLRVLHHMQGAVVDAVDRRYLKQIDAITRRTRKLLRDTQNLYRKAERGRRETLLANMEAQQLTLRAAADYRDYLVDQRNHLAVARQRLARDIAVATNTYETVKVSGELVGLMRASHTLIDNLRNLQVPAPRTFQNLEMKREFERLTLRLRRTGPG